MDGSYKPHIRCLMTEQKLIEVTQPVQDGQNGSKQFYKEAILLNQTFPQEVQPVACLNRTYTAADADDTSVYLCITLDLLLLLNVSRMPAFEIPLGRLVQPEAIPIYI